MKIIVKALTSEAKTPAVAIDNANIDQAMFLGLDPDATAGAVDPDVIAHADIAETQAVFGLSTGRKLRLFFEEATSSGAELVIEIA